MRRFIVFAAAMLVFIGSAQSASAQKVVRISYVTSDLSPQSFQSHKFAEEVEKRLPGVFTFKFYPNGQLSSEEDIIQNLALGNLEMSAAASGALNVDGKLGIFDLPWLFANRNQARKVFAGKLPAEVSKLIESRAQVHMLGIYENGFRNIMSRRKISTPADMKSLKIRISGGRTRLAAFKALGANPTPINWGEVFTSLQTGVVDAVEGGTYGLYEAKFYEVVPNFTITNHIFEPSFLMTSKKFWDGLTQDQQKVFTEVAQEMVPWAFDSAEQNDKKYFADLRKVSTVNQITDVKAFRALVQPVYAAYAKKYGTEWLDMIRKSE